MRLVLAFLLLATPALAQNDPAGLSAYPAAFFQENQPATALDMVRLVPGFRL